MRDHPVECPACGGAGGGPFGRPGSAWDTEDYVCLRCEGAGTVRQTVTAAPPVATRPLAKVAKARAKAPAGARKAGRGA